MATPEELAKLAELGRAILIAFQGHEDCNQDGDADGKVDCCFGSDVRDLILQYRKS
jgi:hypothetical protein